MRLFYKCSLVLLLGIAGVVSSAFGQQQVTGTIYDDATDEPLIGVYVLIPGTSNGTVTDFDGEFSLEAPEGTEQLIVSHVGYQDYLINLDGSGPYAVRLVSGETLDELIVIGYGTVEREDATGSLQAVGEEAFNKGAINSPQELLAGKIPGVQITSGGGAPGSGSNIRIRGGSSLSASNDPLIIVDGIPLASGEFSGLETC